MNQQIKQEDPLIVDSKEFIGIESCEISQSEDPLNIENEGSYLTIKIEPFDNDHETQIAKVY